MWIRKNVSSFGWKNKRKGEIIKRFKNFLRTNYKKENVLVGKITGVD